MNAVGRLINKRKPSKQRRKVKIAAAFPPSGIGAEQQEKLKIILKWIILNNSKSW